MADLLIILALVVLNALAHASYVRWRGRRRHRPALRRAGAPRGFAYPVHPSPSLACAPEHAAAVRPAGIDW
ncbi:MAG TPA: hypothetical protein VHA35_00055 [Dongiaceae bacterium]|jgi:hypothetical protein|nr:hypothetical protein [Dongiaceae bacterium]